MKIGNLIAIHFVCQTLNYYRSYIYSQRNLFKKYLHNHQGFLFQCNILILQIKITKFMTDSKKNHLTLATTQKNGNLGAMVELSYDCEVTCSNPGSNLLQNCKGNGLSILHPCGGTLSRTLHPTCDDVLCTAQPLVLTTWRLNLNKTRRS